LERKTREYKDSCGVSKRYPVSSEDPVFGVDLVTGRVVSFGGQSEIGNEGDPVAVDEADEKDRKKVRLAHTVSSPQDQDAVVATAESIDRSLLRDRELMVGEE
jgi:hypothetical protein